MHAVDVLQFYADGSHPLRPCVNVEELLRVSAGPAPSEG